MQVYQQFEVDIVPATWSVIKNETPIQVFSCELYVFFLSACNFSFLLKCSSSGVFLWILQNVLQLY